MKKWLQGVYSVVKGIRQTHLSQQPVINSSYQSYKWSDKWRWLGLGRGRSLQSGHRPHMSGDPVAVLPTSRHILHCILINLRKAWAPKSDRTALACRACPLLTRRHWADSFLSSLSSFVKEGDLYLSCKSITGFVDNVCKMFLLSAVVHNTTARHTGSSYCSMQFIFISFIILKITLER